VAFTPHSLITLTGKWNQSDMVGEMWQFGFRCTTGQPAGYYMSNKQAYADALATPFQTAWASASNMFWNQALLTSIKVANISAAGTYADQPPGLHTFTGIAGGSSPTSPLTVFCTLAVTLETDGTTRHAKRGRVFPPFALTGQTTAGVTCTSGQQLTAINSVKALLNAIIATPDAAGHTVTPMVFSRVDGSTNFINGVSCNSVIDVQRRRKNRIAGTRTKSVWP
jgi:hypothetical protein